MGIVLSVLVVMLSVILLTLGSYIVSFYHAFDSNRPRMDKYVLLTAVVMFGIFFVLMKWVVIKC